MTTSATDSISATTNIRKDTIMIENAMPVPAGAFPGTIVARHNGYSLRRDERPDSTVNWHTARPANGHRIAYKPGTEDVFSVVPERRDLYGNADAESYARSLIAAVEAASVFAGIVRQNVTA